MADRTIKPKKNGKVKVTVAKAMATVVKITTTSAGTTSMTCRTTSNSLRGGFGASTANSSSSSNQVSGITSGDDSDTSSASTVTDSNATEDESNDSRSYNAPTRNGRNNASVTRVRSLPCQQQAQSSNNSSNGGAAVSNTNFPNATAATATTQGHIYPTLATWPVSSPSSFSQTANRRRDTAVQKLVPPVLYTFHPTDPTASGSDHATKKPRFAAAGVNAMTPTPMLTETPTPDSVGHPRAIATVLTPEMRTPTIAKKKAVSTAYIAMQTPTRVITAAENTKAAAMRLQTGLADSMTVQLGNGRAVTTAAGSNSVGVDDYINSGGIGTNSNTHICTNTNTNQTSSSRRSSSSRSNYHTRSGPPTANQLSQEITTYSRTPRLGITPDDIQAVRAEKKRGRQKRKRGR
ncbi:hypothetical protein BGZ96_005357 [Linnemannia gamsii]|uniref:Uncharacterized protein n=1 Tax=Linnemannia gamsii TaxID=64522 RepID=A0ABQ7K5E1_9FUNG|nr:hypothetical protein BGZ96_005357 [Linnemannia gamsii]